jgi:hypothetical protein
MELTRSDRANLQITDSDVEGADPHQDMASKKGTSPSRCLTSQNLGQHEELWFVDVEGSKIQRSPGTPSSLSSNPNPWAHRTMQARPKAATAREPKTKTATEEWAESVQDRLLDVELKQMRRDPGQFTREQRVSLHRREFQRELKRAGRREAEKREAERREAEKRRAEERAAKNLPTDKMMAPCIRFPEDRGTVGYSLLYNKRY